MSTPKSAVKSRKLEKKRKRKQQARLRRKQRQRRPPGERSPFSLGAPAGVRMSDVLGRFVRPFEDQADGEEAYRRLLTLGVVAWNAAMVPDPDEREEMVDEVIDKVVREEGPGGQTACEEIVNQLIERKKRYFAHYRRPIVSFVLEDMGDGYHLTVMSAIMV